MARWYFDDNASEEIMTESRLHACPFDSIVFPNAFRFLALFLPTNVTPECALTWLDEVRLLY